MKPVTRIYLHDENNERFFGEGPCRLLHGIEEYGSLRSAAIHMNMAYTKAFSLIRHAETALGFPLTEKQIGGKNGGGRWRRNVSSGIASAGAAMLFFALFRR